MFLEKFAFKDMPNACLTFKKITSVSECVIIQTCNRIELFATSDNHNVDEIKNTWASLTGLEDNAFRDTLEVCENRDAYEHLLKLTSGLESLVVGEEQILGQIKESISAARKVDASGKRLNKLFERSIKIGTRIRNSTGIGRGGISLGSMAVKLAEENIDDIKSGLFSIGMGQASVQTFGDKKENEYLIRTDKSVTTTGRFSDKIKNRPEIFNRQSARDPPCRDGGTPGRQGFEGKGPFRHVLCPPFYHHIYIRSF